MYKQTLDFPHPSFRVEPLHRSINTQTEKLLPLNPVGANKHTTLSIALHCPGEILKESFHINHDQKVLSITWR
jgi:hypothetical protein